MYRSIPYSWKFALSLLVGICLNLPLTSASFARSGINNEKEKKGVVEECEVKNFGKLNSHIYRGGQPDEDGYKQLAAVGIRTIIDLREDAQSLARNLTETAGMKYVNLPLNARRPPTDTESDRFLALVNDQANWPVFVHCAGGRHRTGVLLAVYRMEVDGWNADDAYREMKHYKFYKSFGHGDMKSYVFEYYRKLIITRLQSPFTMRDHGSKREGGNNGTNGN
jgi:protein tyrosine/serine phosphatase